VLVHGFHTARAWAQPGLPILHLLGIFQQQELKAMDTNNVLSFAWYPLKTIFDELSGMDTHDIQEMSSKDALVIADRLQAALDNWFTKKRGLANTVGRPVGGSKASDEETNVTDDSPATFELDGKTHTSDDGWDSVPSAVVNKLIAQCAQRGISGASGSSATGSAGNGAGMNRAQQAANNRDQSGVCFRFRDTGTCSHG
jgi:hypothetical protein